MTRSQYAYPPDEFDVRGPDDAPVGVHRAPRSRWRGVWPFLLVAVVAVAVAVGGVMFLSRDPGSADDTSTATQATEAPGDAGDTDATDPATGDATDPAEGDVTDPAEGDATDPAGGEATEAPTGGASDLATLLAAADKGAFVRVLNDGGPAGEAGRGRDALAGQGFTQVEAANYPAGGSGLTETTVWYTEGRQDTATAIAAALGIPSDRVVQQTVRSGDVVVVIKGALTPAG
ncbi:LytR C-terminal domain-containing protein [Xylanimonas ulmi]|uniref:LytR cell envelope-related transcriptional attenuator n=1 Tax=Xylanimonas ulmi TaxID=228973 RepID=A0A4Q7M7J6_9MICO|nr:LytR C-terminal domain-containing protein [Xylanibacterium ulmi]RZS62089.1 LytR cell envelope-related transcriptional attenuator [Xylanibacterium ulmi]